MKTINRGFLFYLFLLLGILLGVFLILVVIMIFVPEFQPAGIKYFNQNISADSMIYMTVEGTENEVKLDQAGYPISKIDVDAPNYSFKIFKSNNLQGINFNQFKIAFTAQTSGFTTEDISKANINIIYKSDGTLKIEAVGPTGFLNFGSNLSIVIQVPPSYNTNSIDLVAKTNSVFIGDVYDTQGNPNPSTLNLKSVNLKSDTQVNITQYVTIGNTSFSDCSIEAGGEITVDTPLRAVNFSIKSGETTATFNNLTITQKLDIETKSTFVYLKAINANVINLKNTYGKMYFKENVTGDVIISSESAKCDYEFLRINGKFTVGSYLDEIMIDGGYISVSDNITGEVVIASTGDITINKVSSLTKIKNISGKITIDEVYGATSIKSVNSEVILGQIKNDEKEFVSNGINTSISVETTGGGKVVACFNTFSYAGNDSSISTNNGDINVYFTENIDREIKAQTPKTLKYLSVLIESETAAWKVGTTAKKLNVNSSNADITLGLNKYEKT